MTTDDLPYDAHRSVTWSMGTGSYAHLGKMASERMEHLRHHLGETHSVQNLPTGDLSWCRMVEIHGRVHGVEIKPVAHGAHPPNERRSAWQQWAEGAPAVEQAHEFDRRHHAWEYPADVDAQDVDRGVTAVMDALRSAPWAPIGLPGQILSLRAIVGIVLEARNRSLLEGIEAFMRERYGDRESYNDVRRDERRRGEMNGANAIARLLRYGDWRTPVRPRREVLGHHLPEWIDEHQQRCSGSLRSGEPCQSRHDDQGYHLLSIPLDEPPRSTRRPPPTMIV